MRYRKAQAATEFTIIISFALIVLTLFLVVFQNQHEASQQRTDILLAQQATNIVLNEITMAEQSPSGYRREFYMPNSLNGMDYDIRIEDGLEIITEYNEQQYVHFLPREVGGEDFFGVGRNIIRKQCSTTGTCEVSFLDPDP